MSTSLHIAPVGLAPWYHYLNGKRETGNSQALIRKQFVTGLSPIPALTCPDTPELSGARSLRRSRHGPLPAGSSHSCGYGFTSDILGNCPKRRTADTSDRCIALPRIVGPPERRTAASLQSCPSAPSGPWVQSIHVQNRNAHGRAGAAEHMDVHKATSRRFCQSRPAFRRTCPAPVCRITAPGILPCGEPLQYAG